MEDKEITGRIENWVWDARHDIIWGNLYDDTRKRWVEGQHIHTSSIKTERSKCVEGAIIETLNSRYLLGKPLEVI